MRKLVVLLAALAIAACSSSTAPSKAGDPSLLFTNNLDHDYVYITWRDGNAIIGKDSVAPMTASQCVRFTAQPDSAYWSITATQTGGLQPETANVTAPYFNPSNRPAWDVIVSANGGASPLIYAWDSAAAVNGPVYGVTRPIPRPC